MENHLGMGVRTTRALRSLMEEQRQSVGWICWAAGGMEESEAGEEGEAGRGPPFIPYPGAGTGGSVLLCPVRSKRLHGSLFPSATCPEGPGLPGKSGPLRSSHGPCTNLQAAVLPCLCLSGLSGARLLHSMLLLRSLPLTGQVCSSQV